MAVFKNYLAKLAETLNKTGEQGPVGEQGPRGDKGPVGDAGEATGPGTGETTTHPTNYAGGKRWYGAGPPGTIVGSAPNDEYVDTITGDLYVLR